MPAGLSPAHEQRRRRRHELRTLTYVTLDQANGGIVRNLTHDGITVHAVTALRPRQQLRVRFELRYPRLRVDTRGEVVWSTFSGRCGIRFLDLSAQAARQIDEWIFGNLLEGLSLPTERDQPILAAAKAAAATPVSVPRPAPSDAGRQPILLAAMPQVEERRPVLPRPAPPRPAPPIEPRIMPRSAPAVEVRETVAPPKKPYTPPVARTQVAASPVSEPVHELDPIHPQAESSSTVDLDWLFQPLSGRSLAWTVNTLVVFAALLLFVLIFLSIAGEAPRWPATMISGAAIVVGGLYWVFFKMFGGASLGVRLARLANASEDDEDPEEDRFR